MDQKPNRLILTMGLPRSGKSTWAKTQHYPIVNPDSIRQAVHGTPFIAEAEPWIWQIAYTMAQALFYAGHTTVIIDATNTIRSRRAEWEIRFPDCEFQIERFDTPKEECIERARASDQEYLIPVIERMAEEMENDEKFKCYGCPICKDGWKTVRPFCLDERVLGL